jgi:hypothetical protein
MTPTLGWLVAKRLCSEIRILEYLPFREIICVPSAKSREFRAILTSRCNKIRNQRFNFFFVVGWNITGTITLIIDAVNETRLSDRRSR